MPPELFLISLGEGKKRTRRHEEEAVLGYRFVYYFLASWSEGAMAFSEHVPPASGTVASVDVAHRRRRDVHNVQRIVPR